jgi:hypothetical protein
MNVNLPENVGLLWVGEELQYGNRPDNLVRAVVVRAGHAPGLVVLRLLEDYDTKRKSGNSFYRAGVEIVTTEAEVWQWQDRALRAEGARWAGR